VRRRRVVVTIDRLTVEGVSAAEARLLTAALEQELASLLAARIPPGLTRGGPTATITGTLAAARAREAEAIGADGARALYRGLGG
jgi:hypothetical protein